MHSLHVLSAFGSAHIHACMFSDRRYCTHIRGSPIPSLNKQGLALLMLLQTMYVFQVSLKTTQTPCKMTTVPVKIRILYPFILCHVCPPLFSDTGCLAVQRASSSCPPSPAQPPSPPVPHRAPSCTATLTPVCCPEWPQTH